MNLTRFETHFLKLISAAAIVQGLVWTALSLTCIVYYHSSTELSTNITTYTEQLEFNLYYTYLKELNGTENNSFVIRPTDFAAFMWVYFLGSAVWVALSLNQYYTLHSKKQQHLPLIMTIWSIIVIAFSIIDFILMSLLARDYSHCVDSVNNGDCFVTVGIVMTLAARGFALWIFNVAAAVLLLFLGIKMYKERYLNRTIQIPRAQLSNQNNNHNWRTPSPHGTYPSPVGPPELPHAFPNRSFAQGNSQRNGY